MVQARILIARLAVKRHGAIPNQPPAFSSQMRKVPCCWYGAASNPNWVGGTFLVVFCEPGELPSTGAIREAREELGVEVRLIAQTGMYIDVYQDASEYTLNIFYSAEITAGTPVAADDALEIGWFGPHDIPENIAFACCRQALEDWRKGAH